MIATDLLTYPSTQTTTTLATYSNLDKAAAGVYSKKGVTYSCPQCLPNYSFDLSAYKDKAVRLQFRAETNSSNPTTFRIDGVSLQ